MKDLIRKILREEIDNHDYSWVNDYLKEDPLEPVKEFIYNKLKDCKLIPSQKAPGFTKYIDKNGDFLFADDIDTGDEYPYLYADYDKIWLKCKEMGCSLKDFQKICKDMLYEVHKRKVHTALEEKGWLPRPLYEVHKRKVHTAGGSFVSKYQKLYEVHKK